MILPCKALYCSADPCLRWPSCQRVPGRSTVACRSSFPQCAAGLPGFRTQWSGRQASGSSTRRTPKLGSAGSLWSLFVVRHLHRPHPPGHCSLLRPLQQSRLKRKGMWDLKKSNCKHCCLQEKLFEGQQFLVYKTKYQQHHYIWLC